MNFLDANGDPVKNGKIKITTKDDAICHELNEHGFPFEPINLDWVKGDAEIRVYDSRCNIVQIDYVTFWELQLKDYLRRHKEDIEQGINDFGGLKDVYEHLINNERKHNAKTDD